MEEVYTYNILLSSPGDLAEDRKLIQDHIEREVNRIIGQFTRIQFKVIAWETDAYSGTASDSPQAVIDRGIPPYDIYLGILWRHLGTPTLGSDSGTLHEYQQARGRKDTGEVHDIMFFFREDDGNIGEIDAHALASVQDFKKQLKEDCSLYFSYAPSQLTNMLTLQFANVCRDLAQKLDSQVEHPVMTSDHRQGLFEKADQSLEGLYTSLFKIADLGKAISDDLSNVYGETINLIVNLMKPREFPEVPAIHESTADLKHSLQSLEKRVMAHATEIIKTTQILSESTTGLTLAMCEILASEKPTGSQRKAYEELRAMLIKLAGKMRNKGARLNELELRVHEFATKHDFLGAFVEHFGLAMHAHVMALNVSVPLLDFLCNSINQSLANDPSQEVLRLNARSRLLT